MTEQTADIEASLTKTMLVDRHRLRQQWRKLREGFHRASKPADPHFEQRFAKFKADLARSCQRADQRRQKLPKLVFDEALPVVARKDEIAAAIRDHQVIVVCGETGSG